MVTNGFGVLFGSRLVPEFEDEYTDPTFISSLHPETENMRRRAANTNTNKLPAIAEFRSEALISITQVSRRQHAQQCHKVNKRFARPVRSGQYSGVSTETKLISRKRAGEVLGVSQSTIYRLVQRGHLKEYAPNGSRLRRVSEDSVLTYFKLQTTPK